MKNNYTIQKVRITVLFVLLSVIRVLATDVVITNFFGTTVGDVTTYNAGYPNEIQVSTSAGNLIQSGSPSCDGSASYSLRTPGGEYLQAYTPNAELGEISFSVTSNGSSAGTAYYGWSTNGTTWTTVAFTASGTGSCFSPNLTPPAGAKYFRIGRGGVLGGNTGLRIYSFSAKARVTGPTLSVSPNSLTDFDYVAGSGPSAVQSFSVSGLNLTAAKPIVVAAPTNFEISLDGIAWTTNISIPNTAGGSLSPTSIYTRLKAGLSLNNFSGSISLTGGGTIFTNPTLSVSGSIKPSIPTEVCSSVTSTQVVISQETFGTFAANASINRSSSPYIDAATFVYGASSGISDGMYAVLTNPKFAGSWAVDGTDHTEDAAGLYGGVLLVNCGLTAGKTVYANVFPICSGANVEFSAWYADANNHKGGSYVYAPNITFNIYGATSATGPFTLVKSTTPAALTTVESIAPIWHQLKVPLTSGSFTFMKLVVTNNVAQTDGNDLLLDDISFSAVLPITLCATDAKCKTSCDGKITLTRASGTASYNFWLNSANLQSGTSANYDNLCAGKYTVRVLDLSGSCFFDLPASIAAPTAIVAKATSVSSCTSGLGSITMTATGGTPGYQYREGTNAWSSNTIIPNLSNGLHTIEVKDGYGCTSSVSATVSITSPATLSLTSAAGTNAQTICNSAAISNIKYAVGGGATGATVTGLPAGLTATYSAGVFTISGTPTQTGSFTYTVTTSGTLASCQDTKTGTITINPLPTIGGTLSTCLGSTATVTGSATAHASTPWISSTPSVATITNAGLVTGLSAGTTTITYMNTNGCTATALFTATACTNTTLKETTSGAVCLNDTIDLTLTLTNLATFMAKNVTVNSNLPTEFSYLSATTAKGSFNPSTGIWTVGNLAVDEVATLTIHVIGTTAGTDILHQSYIATIDAFTHGNYALAPALMRDKTTTTVNPLPTINGILRACVGNTSSLTGSATPHTLTPWVSAVPTIATIANNGIVTGIAAGKSTITYMNSNGCIQDTTFTVDPLPVVTITPASSSICDGDTTTLVASGANSYIWDNGLSVLASVEVSPSIQTSYKVTGIDGNSCKNTATAIIKVNALPVITALSKTICMGESTTLVGTGGVSYVWDGGISDNTAFSPSTTTSYSVTGTDANSCKNTGTASVTVNILPSITATSKTICAGESTKLSGTGAVSYLWDGGVIDNAPFSPAATATYHVTGTDAHGCKNTGTATVTVNELPTVTAVSKVICINESTILNGNGANSYVWDEGITDNTSFAPQETKTYHVTGTDANGCKNTGLASVTVNKLPTPVITSNDVDNTICFGKTLTLNAGSYKKYEWSTLATSATIDITQIQQNSSYSVTVTDDNDCKNSASTKATVYDNPVVNLGNDRSFCASSIILLTATSGMDSYLWSTNETTPSIQVKNTNDYLVTVTKNTCTGVDTVHITVSATTSVNLGLDKEICAGDSITIDAGAGYDTYIWNTGSTNSSIIAKTAGKYSVTVTSGLCQATDEIIVKLNPLPLFTIQSTDSDNTICDGESLFLNAGAYAYYTWQNMAATQAIEVKQAGKYSVTVTDLKGCKNSASTDVIVNSLPTISANSKTICAGETTFLQGIGAKTYVWDGGIIDNTAFMPTVTKTYHVTGTDANGCKNTASTTVVVNNLPSISALPKTICLGESTELIGNGAVSYIWDGGIMDNTSFSPTATKTYNVTGTDANGCKNTASTLITVNQLPSVTATSKNICAGLSSTLSGLGANTYLWSDGIINNQAFVPNITKTYTVTGTDANGCINTATALVTVYPLPNVSAASETICEGKTTSLNGKGANTYKWSDGVVDNTVFTPSTSKTYSVTGTDANGCKNTATATVTVNPLPKPVFVSSDADNSVCDGETVNLSTKESYDKYQWNPTSSNATIDINSLGTTNVSLTVTDINGCINSITTIVRVNEKPIINIPLQSSYCDKAIMSAEVKNVNVSTYSWNTLETTKTIEVTKSQAYSVTITSSDKCTANKTVNPVIYETPHPQLPAIQSICQERTAQLQDASAAKGQTYLWSRNDSALPNTSNILTNLSIAGTYKLVSKMGNCSGEATSQLIVYRLPELISSKKDICFYENSQTITLEGASANWYADIDTTQVLQRNSLIYTPILSATQDSVVLFATITDTHGCVSHLKTMTVRRIPEYKGLQILGDTLRCANQKTGIVYRAAAYLNGVKWNAPHAYDIYKPDGTAIMLRLFNEGLDTLRLSTTDAATGCVYSTQKVIYTSPMPQADFDWQAQTGNMSIHFVNRSDSSVVPEIHKKLSNSYQWTFWKTDELWKTAKHKDTTLIYPYGYHDVRLIATNQYGCKDSIKKTVFMDVNVELFTPNIFYPDHDSKEIAEFRPKGMSLEHYEISIYDQWGNLLWHSTKLINGHPAEGWDGTYDGNTMKSDTYIWKIKAKFTSGVWWNAKDGDDVVFGNVFLLR